ncbi:hypothetical protein ACFLVK_00625 [Chloroflexota bacterium]
MAEIFISHSKRDEDIKNLFSNVFAGLNVAGKFVEFEEYESPPWQFIQERVNAAQSVFVLLGPHVWQLSHTRDWIAWETGLASQAGKDIWVFEPFEQWCDIAIPHVSHYVVYEKTEDVIKYVKLIAKSYDDSGQLASLARGAAVGGGIGSVLGTTGGKKGATTGMGTAGAFLGALIETARTGSSRVRPMGTPIECSACKSSYRVHAELDYFPCPTCRQWIQVDWASSLDTA